MADPSPVAQAVLDALCIEELNGPQQLLACAHAAAALRAAAEQVAPFSSNLRQNTIRGQLLAIAAELETSTTENR